MADSEPEKRVDPRDTSVLAGLFGSGEDVEVLVNRLKQQETDLLDKERSAFERDQESLHSRRRAAEESIKQLTEDVAPLEAKIAEVQSQLDGVSRRMSELVTARFAGATALLAKRSTYAVRFVAEKARVYQAVRAMLSEEWLHGERQLFTWQKEVHSMELERRQLNESELARQTELLKAKQDACRERVTRLENLVEQLRLVGVTRTVSGFLLWAGYLSFAAVGWLVGEELEAMHRAGEQTGSTIFGAIGDAIASLTRSAGIATSLLTLFLVPLVLLGLAFGLLWLWDKRLTAFDNSWTRSTQSPRQGYAPTIWLNADLPVARKTYTDLLAKLPLVYLWSLIPLAMAAIPALSGLQPATSGSAQTSPWDAALFTYAGTVMVLSSTGLALLYVTAVIRPRLAARREEVNLRASLVLNLELVVIAITALVVFAAIPIATVWFPDLRTPWMFPGAYGLSMAVVVVSFATAHGLVFHGIFKDLEKLREEHQQYELALQDSVALPSIEMSGEQAKQFKKRLADLYDDLDRIWASPDWFMILTGQPERVRTRFKFGRRQTEVTVDSQPLITPWDVLLEPALSADLQNADVQLASARQQETSFREDLRRLEERRSSLKEELAQARQALTEALDGLTELTRRHHDRLDRLGREYSDLVFQLRTAFNVGRSLASPHP